MPSPLEGLVVGLLVGSGLVSGILFIFSNTVMEALGRQGEDEGAAAMVSINEIILNPTFFLLFVGTGAANAALVILTFLWRPDGAWMLYTAAGLYIVGVLGVTGAVNVPLNERLAVARPSGEETRKLWHHYLDRWTRWNSVRTGAGVLTTIALAIWLTR